MMVNSARVTHFTGCSERLARLGEIPDDADAERPLRDIFNRVLVCK